MTNTKTPRLAPVWLILCLFAAGFAIRIIGIDYGYFHGDERINDAARVLTGDLIPSQHFYPPLWNYVNALAFAVLAALGVVFGAWDGPEAFRAQYFADPTAFYVTARVMTAAFSAALVPLFFLVLRALRIGFAPALFAAALATLYPLSVLLAHIAKADTAMATMVVFSVFAVLRRHQSGPEGRWDIAVALGFVLAISFKHSSVFLLAPFALTHLIVLLNREPVGQAMRSYGVSLGLFIVLWPFLNIGLVLDFQNFLDYQSIQVAMSVDAAQDGTSGMSILWSRAQELVLGINPILFAAAAAFPAWVALGPSRLQPRTLWLGIWLSLVVGSVVVALMVGPRQPEHLWLANFALALLLGAALLGDMSVRPGIVARGVGIAFGTAGLFLMLIGVLTPIREALTLPIRPVVDRFVSERLAGERVLTAMPLGQPQSQAMIEMDRARAERLAEKYSVELPETAPERLAQGTSDATDWLGFPGVLFGLETQDEDATYTVKAYAWPLQPEEWTLSYWNDRGFNHFIASNLDYNLSETPSATLRSFHQELVDNCLVLTNFSSGKPLFLEPDVTVFECP